MNPWNWIRPVVRNITCEGCGTTHGLRAWRWAKYVSINKLMGWQFNTTDGWRCSRKCIPTHGDET